MKNVLQQGQHLLIDMHGVTTLEKHSAHDLYNFLNELPLLVGMQPISTPQIVFLNNEPPQQPGVSAFVILAESHVSFHTWPESDYVSLDIYSCKKFDVEKAEKHILDFWKPTGDVNKQVVERF